MEFAKNIHAAGADLLNLISDILDLSKIESGTVTVEPEEVSLCSVRDAVERSFRHVAETKHLAFDIETDPQLPRSMSTDVKRLQQVLKNLLSNAFKFTSHGRVTFRMEVVSAGWSADHAALNNASRVIAFEVKDTGIGISPDKQKIIFEAFHQADAGTSRRYGGTGLGLAISRELATLLGRRNPPEQRARSRQYVYLFPAGELSRPARDRDAGRRIHRAAGAVDRSSDFQTGANSGRSRIGRAGRPGGAYR